MPRFRLKPMPFRTFGELPTLGLALEIYCPSCHAKKPLEISDRLAPHRWGRVRFTCSGTRYSGAPCQARGHLHVQPVAPRAPASPLSVSNVGVAIRRGLARASGYTSCHGHWPRSTSATSATAVQVAAAKCGPPFTTDWMAPATASRATSSPRAPASRRRQSRWLRRRSTRCRSSRVGCLHGR